MFREVGLQTVKMVHRLSQDFLLMEVLREDWLEAAEERLAARSSASFVPQSID